MGDALKTINNIKHLLERVLGNMSYVHTHMHFSFVNQCSFVFQLEMDDDDVIEVYQEQTGGR